MIITFVTSHLTVFGGGGIIVMDYANELIKKGYVINVIAQKIDRILYKFNDKIQLIEVGGILPKNLVYWLGFNIIVKKYMKALEHLESDILISIHFPSNFICSKFRENRKVKHIYYCLEPYRFIHDRTFISNAPFNRKILFWIIRFLFKKYDIRGSRNADKIISISEFTKARVNKIYQKDSVVHYIGKSIEDTSRKTEKFDLRKFLALKEEDQIIFTLGLTHYMKGAEELIKIFYRIQKSILNVFLLIGGWITNENKRIIKKNIKKLKIPLNKVIFYGFVEKERLNVIYKNSVLTLFTALDEPYGLVPLESMINGTPVVAFEGGPSETILNGETGYIIDKNDIDGFAQKSINIINNQELREIFSKKAKAHILNNFKFEKSVSKLESILIKSFSND